MTGQLSLFGDDTLERDALTLEAAIAVLAKYRPGLSGAAATLQETANALRNGGRLTLEGTP